MRRKKSWGAIIVTLALLLGLVFSGQSAQAAQTQGTAYVSVEKFTIGQGYLIEPTAMTIEPGTTTCKDVIEKLLKDNGYTYETDTGSSYAITSIDKADSKKLNIPKCIQEMPDFSTSWGGDNSAPTNENNMGNASDSLGSYSYHSTAGWMYTVNGAVPSVTMDSYTLQDGDVMRFQFSVYGYGADLGDVNTKDWYGIEALNLPAKETVTKDLALMKQALKAYPNSQGTKVYQSAIAVVTDMDQTQDAVSKAEKSVSDWLASYKKDLEKAAQVTSKINALGTIALSKQSAVKAARSAYNTLTATQKKMVSSAVYAKLTKAESTIKNLLAKKYTPAKTILKSVKNAGSRKVRLTWKKSTKATGYQVYRSTKRNKGYQKVKTIRNRKTISYKTGKLKKKKTYYFKIRTYKKVGTKVYYGKFSNVKSLKIK